METERYTSVQVLQKSDCGCIVTGCGCIVGIISHGDHLQLCTLQVDISSLSLSTPEEVAVENLDLRNDNGSSKGAK